MSNKFLKYRAAGANKTEPPLVVTDLPCAGCGYNLRGLRANSPCPECGLKMDADVRVPDVLLRGVFSARRRRSAALAIMAACLIGASLARFALYVSLVMLPWPLPSEAYIGFGLAVSATWAWATWTLLEPGIDAPLGLPRGLCVRARYGQFFWIASYVCWLLSDTVFLGTATEERWYVVAVMLRGVAGMSVLLLFAILMTMASQADLEEQAGRIHLVIWLIVLPSIGLILVPATIFWVAAIPVGAVLVLWCWCLWQAGRCVWHMHKHVAWDLRIEADRGTRGERIKESQCRMDRRIEANVRNVHARPQNEVPLE